MATDQVNALCEELVKAVTVMMDPTSTQRYRLEALKFCEEFKEKCPICVPCGLKLAEKTQIAIVRHFGLQILEHVVKFRWNTMSRLEKVYLKNSVMELITNGTLSILEEENHIKDVLSRIVVEMIKREWPQHWPDMLVELDTLSRQGETQTELVMFILLRLAEDVVTFQTLPPQRRRDIQQALTQNMEKIFSFLLNTLQENVNKYQQMKTDTSEESKAQAHCRVGTAALSTLAGYIDWVSMTHITTENCKLLEVLCLLLSEQELQLGAAECLLIAVSRKGKLEDRKPLMVLFGDVAMHYILSAAHSIAASRAQQGEVMRLACRLDPKTSFQMAGEWLKYQLSSSVESGTINSGTGEGSLCSIFSPSFVQWEAMTFFLESVINQMFKTVDKEGIPVSDGIELLHMVLNFDVKDPLILSCVLTNVSALFPFVTYKPEFLPQVFSKLFSSVTFETVEETKAPRTRAVRNVRRHACSSIIKMCRDYPELVLPNFDMLYNHVKQLLSNELLLTQMEKCALMEALVLISNQFKNYERQKLFLEELMAPVARIWLSEEMRRALLDVDSFIAYVGADPKSCDPALEDPCGLNRARMSFCVYSILGVIKRTCWPADLEEAKAGGFVVGYTPSGNPIFRNPCTEQILKLLDNLLALVRTHNSLYAPEMLAKMAEPFAKALDMLEAEKSAILGLPQPLLELNDYPVYKTVLERMQRFFSTLYENCFHILGKAGPSMQQDFYTVEDLAAQLLGSAFINLSNIPDYRLRPMLRVFVKPLVLFCPPEHYEALVPPILGPLFTYLHMRLSQKWQVINQRSQLGGEDEPTEENPESQEMLEEQLVRMLTREVMDLITVCCVSKKSADHSTAPPADGDDEEMMATEVTPPPVAELTELGKCLMKHEDVCTAMLITAFNSLAWKDTLSCQRTTTQLCWPLLKQVLTGTLLAEAVTWLFTSVLKGLQMHGQHDGCMASLVHLAFQIYETLRPRYIEIRAVMEQIPEIQKDALDQFDSKLLNPSLQKAADKRRKDHFKRLIAGCIGKPLGEQFRKEVHIKNLPSLFKKAKPMQETEVLDSDGGSLATIFEP
ncbi:PREDICTED: exportin-5 [Dipodomys ordii]|uniref:Exportin-5 n=1 Tax=Dipodomys ordii TaxID=10020 RepID=A0A1S3FD57_DIPOR|nr:PREDICTED: exportin-5 [Dipodomys ordii]